MPGYEYREGFRDGYEAGYRQAQGFGEYEQSSFKRKGGQRTRRKAPARKKARKLTAWNRYVKNKKNHIKMRDGKLNLKKMAVQFRKKKR